MTPTVRVSQQGRSGQVTYQEGRHAITGYQEFGGGDVVAIVSMGHADDWRARHPWAVERRAEILRFVARELIRQHAPTCRAEIDETSGDLLLRSGGGVSGAPSPDVTAVSAHRGTPAEASAAWVHRYHDLRGRLGAIGLMAVLAVGAALWMQTRVLVTQPGSGTPVGLTVRTDTHLATLIAQTQPYPVSLHHDPSAERHTLSLLLVPLDGAAPQLVPLLRDRAPDDDRLVHVIGSDGQTLWVAGDVLVGANLRTGVVVTEGDVLAANPGWDPRWIRDARAPEVVDGRVHLLNADHSAAMALDPVTWRAARVTPTVVSRPMSPPPLTRYLAAGLIREDGTWLGVHSAAELTGEFRVGRWLRPVESAGDAPREVRQLFRGDLDPPGDDPAYRRIRGMTAIGDAGFHNAAFLRDAESAPPLRVAGPDSVVMLHTSGDGMGADTTLLASRVDVASGRVLWTADTAIHRFALEQVLPGERATAFVGTRPPVPGKGSEPLLALLDHATGAVAVHSLWR